MLRCVTVRYGGALRCVTAVLTVRYGALRCVTLMRYGGALRCVTLTRYGGALQCVTTVRYGVLWCVTEVCYGALRCVTPPFPQIDIIGDVVIVWRVRGKTIRSVLCNIVCNNCAQCDAHTYEHSNSSMD